MPTNANQRRLDELQARYHATLPSKITAVRSSWDQPGDDLSHFHHLIHQLAGSSAFYGYADVAAIAKVMDRALKQGPNSNEDQARWHREIGIGLEMLERYVEESLQADPASFRVLLPSSGSQSTDKSLSTSLSSDRRPLIYIVDDDPDTVEALALAVSAQGYRVTVFNSYSEVINAPAGRPQVLIMDIAFPEGEDAGFDLVARIEQRVGYRPAVIYVSASDDIDTRVQAARSGGSAYFVKPLQVPSLMMLIEHLTRVGAANPYRILALEDDAEQAEWLKLVFSEPEFQLVVNENHATMLETVKRFEPELVLMDLYLGSVDGLDLTAVLRQDETNFNLPIVLFSQETNLAAHDLARKAGIDDSIDKGIEPEILKLTIADRIRRTRRHKQLLQNAAASESD